MNSNETPMNDFKSQRDARLAAKAARRPVPVALAPKPVLVAESAVPASPAPTAAEVAALKAEIAAFRAGPAEKPFPGENHAHIEAEAYPPSPSRAAHEAAIALIRRDPTLSYREAVVRVTRRAS